VASLARDFLDASEPLASALLSEARKNHEAPWRASSAVQVALARDANEGWPAHLSARWLDETLHALAPRGVEVQLSDNPTGGASFLRAAMSWGFAFRAFGPPRSTPFGLARDPYPVSAFRFAALMASVVASPLFQRRALELSERSAAAQVRTLRKSLLFGARVVAVRTLLASVESVTPTMFEELTSRAFGAPLPASMADAWPSPNASEPARFLGTLGALGFAQDLVNRYDEDWFRNPRAGSHLVSLACGPAFDDEPLAAGSPLSLARAFEEVLG
jgi:hypothetical protein